MLTNTEADGRPTLPLPQGLHLYVEGVPPRGRRGVRHGGAVAGRAGLAVLWIQAPFEQRTTKFENFFHAGSLDFAPDVVARFRDVAAKVPTVVDVFLDRPAILTPFVHEVATVVANWGASPQALLDVLTGAAESRGALRFDLLSSRAAVGQPARMSRSIRKPLFHFGHGLSSRAG